MGFFDRISALWKGKATQAVSDIENNNPEAVYEAAIANREKQYIELKKAAGGITLLRNKTQEQLEKSTNELERVEGMILAAVQGGEDDAALVLLEEKSSLTTAIQTHEASLVNLKAQAEESMSSLRHYQAEIEKLKEEKHEMLAKARTADATVQIQETLTGLSEEADIRGLSNVRESIDRLSAEADTAAVDGTSSRLSAQARKELAQSNAKAELAALKAAMGGGVATSATTEVPAETPSPDGSTEDPEGKPPTRTL